jgi:7-carboxy-7-deazaguanine synthase
MHIAELFYSLQGEGSLLGVPSYFVRTSGCNLRCTWCDTPYASWQPEGQMMTVEEIFAALEKLDPAHAARHLVITGGEPMLQKDLVALTQAARARGWHITIETAGTIAPLPGLFCDLVSLSPKLAHATPTADQIAEGWVERHEKTRWQPTVLAAWIRAHAWQLKYVITAESDLAELHQQLDVLRVEEKITVPAEQVFLMAEGTSTEVLRSRALWLAEVCKKYGYRYSPRLHVDLYGHQRGT